jgi:hypothetical protein
LPLNHKTPPLCEKWGLGIQFIVSSLLFAGGYKRLLNYQSLSEFALNENIIFPFAKYVGKFSSMGEETKKAPSAEAPGATGRKNG